MQSLGERLLLLRRRHGWTQKDLAEKVGLSTNTIARVERNLVKTLRGDTIAQLARVLSTTTDYLLGLVDDPEKKHQCEAAAEDRDLVTSSPQRQCA
jgi:transcriptional regulator with XRE-family HTH domain